MFKVGDIVRLKDAQRNKNNAFWRSTQGQDRNYDALKVTHVEPRGEGVVLCCFRLGDVFGILSPELELASTPW